ncbi:hypothetical protein WICPIJ_002333 [Wickerhamomyces pijperi]|uniref:Uncharacterized protein n=1 Tax=Wickerhamomyces pijperi TaxID=599730 RepID=A0A9P8TPY2_WICPI|nr:hypothetical protein WICPIJ_002333 [Wickerhamomyces pijperi]
MVNFAEYQLRKKQKALEQQKLQEKQQQQQSQSQPQKSETKTSSSSNSPSTTEVKENISSSHSSSIDTKPESRSVPKNQPSGKLQPFPKIKLPTGPSSSSTQPHLPTPPVSKDRAKSRSDTISHSNSHSKPPNNAPIKPTWTELQSFIRAYHQSKGQLPPMLTAELPKQYQHTPIDNGKLTQFPKMLSPTLPPRYITPSLNTDSDNSNIPNLNLNYPNDTIWTKQENFTRRFNEGAILKLVNTDQGKKLLLKLKLRHVGSKEKDTQRRKVIDSSNTNNNGRVVRRIVASDEEEDEPDHDQSPKKRKQKLKSATSSHHQRSSSVQLPTPSPMTQGRSNSANVVMSVGDSGNPLVSSAAKYLKMSKESKKLAELKRSESINEAILWSIDSLCCLLLSYNHEEGQEEDQLSKGNRTKWKSVITQIDSILATLDLQSSSPSSNHPYSHLISLLNQLKSVLATRLIKSYKLTIQSNQSRRDQLLSHYAQDQQHHYEGLIKLDSVIMNQVTDLFKYQTMSDQCIAFGDKYLSLWTIMKQYSDIFHICETDQPMLKLPVTSQSSLKEAIWYAVLVLKSWASGNGVTGFKSKLSFDN